MAVLAPRIFNTLSGGEKARTHLARALAQVWKPPGAWGGAAARWLLLDEPTAALDLAHQHQSLRLYSCATGPTRKAVAWWPCCTT